jgi:hypothetical protein
MASPFMVGEVPEQSIAFCFQVIVIFGFLRFEGACRACGAGCRGFDP